MTQTIEDVNDAPLNSPDDNSVIHKIESKSNDQLYDLVFNIPKNASRKKQRSLVKLEIIKHILKNKNEREFQYRITREENNIALNLLGYIAMVIILLGYGITQTWVLQADQGTPHLLINFVVTTDMNVKIGVMAGIILLWIGYIIGGIKRYGEYTNLEKKLRPQPLVPKNPGPVIPGVKYRRERQYSILKVDKKQCSDSEREAYMQDVQRYIELMDSSDHEQAGP